MSRRTQVGWSIHDRVIQTVAVAQTAHDTYTNPGQDHNCSVQIGWVTVYPDLILCRPSTMIVTHLFEVETVDSVTDTESVQWEQYPRGPGLFWLLVPHTALAAAQETCRRKRIAANFGRWWIDQQQIQFDWLRAGAA